MAKYKKTIATVLATRLGTGVGGGGHIAFHPIITYQYTVNGQQYVSENYFRQHIGQRSRALVQRALDKNPPQSQIEIFYNVNNPQDAYVKEGASAAIRMMLLVIVIALVLVFGGLLAFLYSFGAF